MNRMEQFFESEDDKPVKTSVDDNVLDRMLQQFAKMAGHNKAVHGRLCTVNRDIEDLWKTDNGKMKVLRSLVQGTAQNNHMLSMILSAQAVQLDRMRNDD